MAMPMVTTRYASRFACIGSACEDACCSGWAIGIDADHHAKLTSELGQTKRGRTLFEQNVKRIKDGTRTKFALMVLNDGDCGFFGRDKLCTLHARFGERLLPDVCATYPKRYAVVEDRLELAATMSCPEAARLALVPLDAMQLVDAERPESMRDLFVHHAPTAVPDSYEGAIDHVRIAMMTILSNASSVSAGLGTLVALAHALGDSFAKGARVDAHRLLVTLEAFAQRDRARQVAEGLDAIDAPLWIAMHPLLELLSARLQMPEGRFRALLENAMSAYAIGHPAIVGDVANAYAARRDRVSAHVEARLAPMLVNYALNHVFTHWYSAAPNLATYVRGLVLRVALVRFLAFAHPDVAALGEGATESDAHRTVERVVVDIVHRMTREIDHHKPFTDLLDDVLPRAMPRLEQVLCLAKL